MLAPTRVWTAKVVCDTMYMHTRILQIAVVEALDDICDENVWPFEGDASLGILLRKAHNHEINRQRSSNRHANLPSKEKMRLH